MVEACRFSCLGIPRLRFGWSWYSSAGAGAHLRCLPVGIVHVRWKPSIITYPHQLTMCVSRSQCLPCPLFAPADHGPGCVDKHICVLFWCTTVAVVVAVCTCVTVPQQHHMCVGQLLAATAAFESLLCGMAWPGVVAACLKRCEVPRMGQHYLCVLWLAICIPRRPVVLWVCVTV